MSEMRFRIGDFFDPEDSVARFLAGLAMISNDWLRLFSEMQEIEDWHLDAEGKRLLSFRLQISLLYEAADFIKRARRRFPRVVTFISQLPDEAQQAAAQVEGGIDPKSDHYLGGWLYEHRNRTFHYRLDPHAAANNTEGIAEALKKAADIDGTITEEPRQLGFRFGFADQLAVQWLPDLERPVWVERLQGTVIALNNFVREAAVAYLNAHDQPFEMEH